VEKVSATLVSESQPAAGSAAERVQIARSCTTHPSAIRSASSGAAGDYGAHVERGWGSCSSCHPFGLSDNVVWIFGAGPRRTIPQHVDFAGGDATTLRALNWSAIFDEEEDFEGNIRGTSGGLGIIVMADGVTQDPNVAAFTPATGGRAQLRCAVSGGGMPSRRTSFRESGRRFRRHRRPMRMWWQGGLFSSTPTARRVMAGRNGAAARSAARAPDASLVWARSSSRNCGRRAHSIPRQPTRFGLRQLRPLAALVRHPSPCQLSVPHVASHRRAYWPSHCGRMFAETQQREQRGG